MFKPHPSHSCARVQGEVIQKLQKFVPVHSAVLLMAILRLLHNLAFDKSARAELVASGVVPKLVDIMQEPRYSVPASVVVPQLQPTLLIASSSHRRPGTLHTHTGGTPPGHDRR